MNKTPQCQRCGAPLTPDALEGLCPRCLLALSLAAPTEVPGETGPHGTKVVKPPPSPAEIAKHFPQFEILECLGRGGMGVVYKARQPKLNRIVALKILAPEKVAEPKFAERFEREAQALARLNHQNIVIVYDFGETDGLYYLLMEFVDGVSLRRLLQTRKIAPEEALAIVPKICEALQFAHDQGVVHRDIKPENVLLDKQGRVKIADFGIAKIVGEPGRAGGPLPAAAAQPAGGARGATRPTGALTQDQVLGTPHYMAPEQVEKPQMVDHRADIYSLGVVFYEMLTGELPLGKFQPPSKKVQVDVRLDEVVLHTLEKEPDRRYQHASEVKSDVETIAATREPGRSLGGEAHADKSEIRTSTPAFESRFSRTAIVGASLITLVAPAALLLFVARHEGGPGQTPTTLGLVLAFVLVPLAIASVFGTTILGWVSVSRIRHSAGKLYGLGLAVFDGLLFPLLALDGFIFILGRGLVLLAQHWINQQGLHESVWHALVPWLLVLLIYGGIAIADYWIIRRVWRAVTKPLPDFAPGGRRRLAQTETESPQHNQAQDRFWRRFAVTVVAVVLALILIPVGSILLAVLVPALSQARLKAQRLRSSMVTHTNGSPTAVEGSSFGAVTDVTATTARTGDIGVELHVEGRVESSNSVSFAIPESYCQDVIRKFDAHQALTVEAFDTQRKKFGHGLMTWVDNRVDPDTGTLKCRASLVPGEGNVMLLGESLGVHLLLEVKHGVTLVPVDAISRDAQGTLVVWVIKPDQTVSRRRVQVGTRDGANVEVQSGLLPGELVVTGREKSDLHEGQRIRYKLVIPFANQTSIATTASQAGPLPVARAKAGEYKVTLTNGMEFEVVAIASSPRSGLVWWRPDGTLLTEPPGDRLEFPSKVTGGQTRTEFAILTRRTGGSAFDQGLPLAFEPRPRMLLAAKLHKTNAPAGSVAVIAFDKAPEKLTCRFGLPDGEWQRVATWDHAGTLLNTENTNLQSLVQKTTGKDIVLMVNHEIDLDRFHLRLVARLRNGKDKPAQIIWIYHGQGLAVRVWALVHDLKPSDVVAYELYRVPALWIEIPNISTKPNVPPIERRQATAIFGPEKEVTLTAFNNRDGQVALDLDTGTMFKQPRDIYQWSNPSLLQWVKEHGIDLLIDQGRGEFWGLLTAPNAELKVARVGSGTWRRISERQLARAFSDDPTPHFITKGVMKLYLSPKGAQPPMTWAFKTCSGSLGLLQITGFTDNPHGVKLRYKLVKAAARAASVELGKPIPPEAVRLYNEFKTLVGASAAKRSDTNAVATAFAELSALGAKLETLIQGTAAEPLAKQHRELTRQLREAVQSQDSARVKECTEQLIAIGRQNDALFRQAAADNSERNATEAQPGVLPLKFGASVPLTIQSAGIEWNGRTYHLVSLDSIQFDLDRTNRLTAKVHGRLTLFAEVAYDISAAVFDTTGQLLGTARTQCNIQALWAKYVMHREQDLVLDFGVSLDYPRAATFMLSVNKRKVLKPGER